MFRVKEGRKTKKGGRLKKKTKRARKKKGKRRGILFLESEGMVQAEWPITFFKLPSGLEKKEGGGDILLGKEVRVVKKVTYTKGSRGKEEKSIAYQRESAKGGRAEEGFARCPVKKRNGALIFLREGGGKKSRLQGGGKRERVLCWRSTPKRRREEGLESSYRFLGEEYGHVCIARQRREEKKRIRQSLPGLHYQRKEGGSLRCLTLT